MTACISRFGVGQVSENLSSTLDTLPGNHAEKMAVATLAGAILYPAVRHGIPFAYAQGQRAYNATPAIPAKDLWKVQLFAGTVGLGAFSYALDALLKAK
jgi:hypothetical protein